MFLWFDIENDLLIMYNSSPKTINIKQCDIKDLYEWYYGLRIEKKQFSASS